MAPHFLKGVPVARTQSGFWLGSQFENRRPGRGDKLCIQPNRLSARNEFSGGKGSSANGRAHAGLRYRLTGRRSEAGRGPRNKLTAPSLFVWRSAQRNPIKLQKHQS
jgi:hypothetical protein